ncbi:hypothetical protein HK100_005929, partial [Physocladia obscura]
FKFDDDRVTPCFAREVFEENFGGESLQALKQYQANITLPKPTKRFTNAYMLIYIREQDTEHIFAPIETADIQEHLRSRMQDEKIEAARKQKEREEQHLFINMKVVLEEHTSKHRGFDLCNFDSKTSPITEVLQFKEKREETLAEFKEILGQSLNVPADHLNIWSLIGRQNKTVRPDFLFTAAEDILTLEQLREKYSSQLPNDLRIFVEIIDPITNEKTQKTDKSVTVFLKYYDPTTSIVKYAGKVFVPNKSSKINEILPTLLSRASLPPKTPLLLFEEIKPDMVESLKLTQSFGHAEIGDGDIILYQRNMAGFESQIEDMTISTVKEYFDNMHNRHPVNFKPRQVPNINFTAELELVVSKKMPYDQVVSKLAEKLGADPLKILLYTSAGMLTKSPIRKNEKMVLQDMLNTGFYNQLMPTSVLYYEVLDVEVTELETKKFVPVSFVDRLGNEFGPYNLLVRLSPHASDVIKKLRSQVTDLPVSAKADLRMYEVIGHKIQKFYSNNESLKDFGETSLFYVEEIFAEDKLAKGDSYVHVFHFNGHVTRSHGIPFKFPLRKGEKFEATKERLLGRFEMNDPKAKWFIVPSGFAQPIQIADSDVLADKSFGPYDYIGVDHVGKVDRTARDINAGKGIKISN